MNLRAFGTDSMAGEPAEAIRSERGLRSDTDRIHGRPLRIRALDLAAVIAPRLPMPFLVLVAEVVGELRYRLRPHVRRRVRGNLARTCAWLVANDMATPRVRRAAGDRRALERLVRSAFRHHARTYLELVVMPALGESRREAMLDLSSPDHVAEAIRADRPSILVGLHLGSIELQALTVAQLTGRPTTTTMEEIADRHLQAWFERSRAMAGVRLVPLREARRALAAALARGESVGLVADRDVTGGGMPVELFGAPTPLPIGPALLAVETGAPIFVGAIRRVGRARYRGRLIALATPPEGRRRDRVLALMHAQARAFERLIAPAPDQWWSIFFPIWPDLEAGAGSAVAATRAAAAGPASGSGSDRSETARA